MSFEQATQAFLDPFLVTVKDRIEDGEQRWRAFGEVDGVLLLMVAHTAREEEYEGRITEIIRLISARRATRKERQRYEEENS